MNSTFPFPWFPYPVNIGGPPPPLHNTSSDEFTPWKPGDAYSTEDEPLPPYFYYPMMPPVHHPAFQDPAQIPEYGTFQPYSNSYPSYGPLPDGNQYREFDHKTRKWYYHSIKGTDTPGYTGAVFVTVLILLLWIYSMYRLWLVWAFTLNFDGAKVNGAKGWDFLVQWILHRIMTKRRKKYLRRGGIKLENGDCKIRSASATPSDLQYKDLQYRLGAIPHKCNALLRTPTNPCTLSLVYTSAKPNCSGNSLQPYHQRTEAAAIPKIVTTEASPSTLPPKKSVQYRVENENCVPPRAIANQQLKSIQYVDTGSKEENKSSNANSSMLDTAVIQLLPNSSTALSPPNLHCSINRGELPTLTEEQTESTVIGGQVDGRSLVPYMNHVKAARTSSYPETSQQQILASNNSTPSSGIVKVKKIAISVPASEIIAMSASGHQDFLQTDVDLIVHSPAIRVRSIESSSTTTCLHSSFQESSNKFIHHDNKAYTSGNTATSEDDATVYTRENLENDGKEEQRLFASYCKTTVV